MSENCGELIISAEDLARIQIACQWSSILALLLFYNLDAQSAAGLSLSPVGAGLSLLPLSCGLLIVAFSAPSLVGRFGPRRALTGAMLLIAVAAVVVAVAMASQMWVPLVAGLFAIGAGLALPYATAPRLALSTLPPSRAGAGSGVINACTFLWGKHRCGRRCDCLRHRWPVGSDGIYFGVRAHRVMALPRTGREDRIELSRFATNGGIRF